MSVISRIGPQSGTVSESSVTKALEKEKNFSLLLAQASQKSSDSGVSQSPREELGVITSKNYTVSHLLFQNRKYAAHTWDIIHNPANRDKDFTKMEPGTRVSLNPETLEITWDREKPAGSTGETRKTILVKHSPELSPETNNLANDLVLAVSREIGKNYEDVDCYELVVKGLSSLGIRYGGRGGLKEALMNKALATNRPPNAFLTGEGLVSACGTNLFSGAYMNIKDPEALAKEVYDSLGPLLRHGGILSLSTRSRGHTGVVASRDDQWTYINSGRMDNNIGDRVPSQGVGEEDLLAELGNWFRLAKGRDEALSITLGELNHDKLMAYSGPARETILV
ncbi:MAG: hypothetical protein JEZ02_13225 [Desulfatibacillum sp.]|nr:hypothetical protein [Desulfatibacillum sp.]